MTQKATQKKLLDRQSLIIKTIQEALSITRKGMAQKTGLSDSTIKRELAILKAKGFIARQGSLAHGIWVINT